jgi:tetrathionate reductase subunit B
MSDDDKAPSRRDFVKTAGLAATAVAAATVPVALTANTITAVPQEPTSERKTQYGMVVDVRRCIGCHSCTVACKTENDVPAGYNRTWVEYVELGEYPNVARSFLPRICNHCSVPQCVTVCPTGATYKRPEDGVVVVDSGVCIGCKYCIQACPYDARFLNPLTGFADKCDFCIHRVSKGVPPACVETCVGGARIFGDVGDPDSTISKLIAKNPTTVLRREMGTMPNVYYIGANHTDEYDRTRPEVRHVEVTTNTPHEKRR